MDVKKGPEKIKLQELGIETSKGRNVGREGGWKGLNRRD